MGESNGPAGVTAPRDPAHRTWRFTVDTQRIPASGDPFSARKAPSTRHHRVDEDFVELLEEDFGVAHFALSVAFLGMPAEP